MALSLVKKLALKEIGHELSNPPKFSPANVLCYTEQSCYARMIFTGISYVYSYVLDHMFI